MAKRCQMTIGFLIPRPCENKARSTCIQCGKAVCDEHAVILDTGIVCAACHEGIAAVAVTPLVPQLPRARYRDEDFAFFEGAEETGDFFADMS
jgi:hypothetical protein